MQQQRCKSGASSLLIAVLRHLQGGFEREGQAGRAHDVMALKCRGEDGPLNRPASEYDALRPLMDEMSTVWASAALLDL